MKNVILTVLCAGILVACASRKSTSQSIAKGKGHTRKSQVVLLDDRTFLLTELASDSTYGYSQKNPIDVGGAITEGVLNQRRFLNALLGPDGEPVSYFRGGSCCHFKTPNGMNNTGLLDIYRVSYEGSKDTVTLYLNLYDEGDLFIPRGFTAKSM